MHEDRLAILRQVMEERSLETLALLPGPSLFYLSGLSFHLLERPIVCFFNIKKDPLIIVPELERSKVEASHLKIDVLDYGEDSASRLKAFDVAGKKLGLEKTRVGIEPLGMRAYELRLLEGAAADVKLGSAEDIVADLRVIKQEGELSQMRQAVKIAENALSETLSHIEIGMSEHEVASELVIQLLRAGCDDEIPFKPIIASGANSAIAHATPTDRQIQWGDLLLIDFGARSHGYISDITRTFAIGEIDSEMKEVYDIVEQANAAGKDAVVAGVSCCEVDRVTRSVIEAAGYGAYFIHRTGHGIGLEGHERPYIAEDNKEILSPGMTFTIEPGIYIPGRGGIRIEDNVVVTAEGGESLTTYTRDLQVIS
jgi:Xaa-Pro dipeptidase